MDTNELLSIRGKTHGDFTIHAEISMGLKEQIEACQNWSSLSFVQKEALHMIQHKIGRILAGDPNHKDHWDDIAGYAKLVSDRLP
jgi:hypothetical protein